MPSASISAYIWKVVSGVRSSWVTAETKEARRSLSRITPASSPATAAAARSTPTQAMPSDTRIGESDRSTLGVNSVGNRRQCGPLLRIQGTSPGTSRTGRAASIRGLGRSGATSAGSKSACGSRSAMVASSESLIVGQSSTQPCTYS